MLTSLQNPLVKQLRKLHQTKERHRQQVFLLEGTHLVEEACAAHLPLSVLCFTEAWQTRYPDLCQQAAAAAERVEVVSPEIIAAIATTVTPDGVVATAGRDRLHESVPVDVSLGLAIESLQDPGNVGTIIRTAAAAGVDGLWISPDSVDLDHPKVLRASAGQWFRLPMMVSSDLVADVQERQAEGMQIVATLPTASKTYWELDFTQPTLILIGNEGAGLSPELAQLADEQVQIPLAPGVESLNAAIATALILYEARRQRTQR
ncbi:MAG: RNA methyltransferase [Synechococcales cyanobacterium T60_A2020_003]|nr:RNA methyltransferase [Synechococcales cyanobacterium T60_A2020_003]